MPYRRMVMELGMGTDIRGQDYTKAAIRAVENALRQNALVVSDAFGKAREEMKVDIHIGAGKPEEIDKERIAAILPYGNGTVTAHAGGLDTFKDDGTSGTIMVNAALVVYLDLPDTQEWLV